VKVLCSLSLQRIGKVNFCVEGIKFATTFFGVADQEITIYDFILMGSPKKLVNLRWKSWV
jgi:hypothetical protein